MRAMLVVAAVAGCGGHGFGSVSIEDYASRVKQALCDRLVTCGEFPDTATCVNANIGFRFHLDPSVIAAVNAGTVKYDASKAGDCLSQVSAAGCDRTAEDTRVTPAVCDEVVAGTVAGGGACAIADECISLSCTLPANCPAGQCCQGTCNGDTPPVREVALGGTCTTNAQCAAGGYCDTTATAPTCTALKVAGTACTNDNQCNYGLGCSGGACAVPPATGQPCAQGIACRDLGAYCNSANTCTAVAPVGAACSATVLCSPYYTCDGTGHCATGPRSGQPCMTTGALQCFDDNTFCDATSLTCTPLLADGAACTTSSQCVNDLCTGTATAMTCTTAPTCI